MVPYVGQQLRPRDDDGREIRLVRRWDEESWQYLVIAHPAKPDRVGRRQNIGRKTLALRWVDVTAQEHPAVSRLRGLAQSYFPAAGCDAIADFICAAGPLLRLDGC